MFLAVKKFLLDQVTANYLIIKPGIYAMYENKNYYVLAFQLLPKTST